MRHLIDPSRAIKPPPEVPVHLYYSVSIGVGGMRAKVRFQAVQSDAEGGCESWVRASKYVSERVSMPTAFTIHAGCE